MLLYNKKEKRLPREELDRILKELKKLIIKRKYDKVEEICNRKELEYEADIQIKYIQMLTNKGNKKSIEKAKAICCKGEFIDNPNIQTQLVMILLNEKTEESKNEVLRICRREAFQKYMVLQKILINELMKTGNEEDMKEVYEIVYRKTFKKDPYFTKLKKELVENSINKTYTGNEKKLEPEQKTEQPILKSNKYLDKVKTKVYYYDIDISFIEEVKRNTEDLNTWERYIALIAIYDKTRNFKMLSATLKNAKKEFAEDANSLKKLNKLQNITNTKKAKIFDFNLYEGLVAWTIDESVHQEIIQKREMEEKEEKEKQAKIEKEIQARSEKKEEKTKTTKVLQISKAPESNLKQNITSVVKSHPKTKKVAKKVVQVANTPENNKNITIHNKFQNEISKMKGIILVKTAQIEYEDDRLKVPDKRYKVPPEAVEELRAKIKSQEDLVADLDRLDMIGKKPEDDFRAKIQMVLFLRKYGMRDIANQKLGLESEVFDNILELYMNPKENLEENDSTLENIMNKIESIEGNNDYAYDMLNKIISREDER